MIIFFQATDSQVCTMGGCSLTCPEHYRNDMTTTVLQTEPTHLQDSTEMSFHRILPS